MLIGARFALVFSAMAALSFQTTKSADKQLTPVTISSQDVKAPGGVRESLVYINNRGEIVLRMPYSRGGYFSEGLAPVGSNPCRGYIDSTGRLAISGKRFERCGDFSEGMAPVQTGDSEYRYIDSGGNWAVAGMFRLNASRSLATHSFRNGRAAAIRDDGSWGFIDRTGRFMGRFDEARPFHEGMAPVRVGDKWGFVDTSCDIEIPPQFDSVGYDALTPGDRASWTRPKLIPDRVFFGIRDPKLVFSESGRLLFSFVQTEPGDRNLMEGTDVPRAAAPQLGPQQWRLLLPEIERDSDQDGWTDIEEARLGLDPHNPDSDGDGIPDGRDVCPNYAPSAADARDEEVQMLRRALFAAFGLSGSRYLLLPEPGSRRIQLRDYRGPVIYGQTRKAWSRQHPHLAFYVSWEVACIRGDKARVRIDDWEGPLASGSQDVILRKIGKEWFAVKWLPGAIS